MSLDMQGVPLLEGDVWGHRKDINEYYEIKPEIFDHMKELKREDKVTFDSLINKARAHASSCIVTLPASSFL